MAETVQIFTPGYYDRLKEIEGAHWWSMGMTDLMETLLAGRLDAPRRLLDVGCGSGIGLAWSARRLPASTRMGLDLSRFALDHCAGLGAALLLGSSEALPLTTASVDFVLCVDVFQHVPDDRLAAAEIARVLRPGGLFYARTNARSFAPPPPGSRLYTPALLRERLEGAGLHVLSLSRANALGSLVADAARLRGDGAHGHAHAHGHDHEHAHGHAHAQDGAHANVPADGAPQEFRGGGYGGGLRLSGERRPGLASRLKRRMLQLEGHWIRSVSPLPLGDSLVALARR